MTELVITYKGVTMEVVGNYHPAEPDTWAGPGSPSEFFVEEIYIGDQQVTHLLKSDAAAIERVATEVADGSPGEIRRQAMRDFSPTDSQLEAMR